MEWERQRIRLATCGPTGQVLQAPDEVDAEICGAFAVHAAPGPAGRFLISHVLTGWRVLRPHESAGSAAAAKAIAEALMTLPIDWNFINPAKLAAKDARLVVAVLDRLAGKEPSQQRVRATQRGPLR